MSLVQPAHSAIAPSVAIGESHETALGERGRTEHHDRKATAAVAASWICSLTPRALGARACPGPDTKASQRSTPGVAVSFGLAMCVADMSQAPGSRVMSGSGAPGFARCN